MAPFSTLKARSVFSVREQVHVTGAFPITAQTNIEAGKPYSGISGMVPGVIGSVMKAEALKLLIGIGTSLSGHLLVFDALEASFN